MKVSMFIELVSGGKYPKITTVGLFLKQPFVDVLPLWMQVKKLQVSQKGNDVFWDVIDLDGQSEAAWK